MLIQPFGSCCYFGNCVCCDAYFGKTYGYDPDEYWYNPGFLEEVDAISDVITSEIFSCLGAHSFSTLISNLKFKTVNDEEVDEAYEEVDTDWS